MIIIFYNALVTHDVELLISKKKNLKEKNNQP